MKEQEAEAAVLAFIQAINHHDVDSLLDLMTEDHVFVDSLGHVIEDSLLCDAAKLRSIYQARMVPLREGLAETLPTHQF